MEKLHNASAAEKGVSAPDTVAVPWIPILMYHRVVPVVPSSDTVGNCVSSAAFEKQLQWLVARGYGSLPLERLAAGFDKNGAATRSAPPARPIVLTFDDGYADNYEYAWPLLQKYGFTATIFLVTQAIGGANAFDQDVVGPSVPMLSLPQIRRMQESGITFGSHTCTHPTRLADLEERTLQVELLDSRLMLQDLLQISFCPFAYPHSKLDARVEAAVQHAGYEIACAGVGTRFSQFCLHRLDPGSRTGIEFEAYLRLRQTKWFLRKKFR